jgi:hypothetical protein
MRCLTIAAMLLLLIWTSYAGAALNLSATSVNTADVERSNVVPAGSIDVSNGNPSGGGNINIREVDVTVSNTKLISTFKLSGQETGSPNGTPLSPSTVASAPVAAFSFNPPLTLAPEQGIHWDLTATISMNPVTIEHPEVRYASALPPGRTLPLLVMIIALQAAVATLLRRRVRRIWMGIVLFLLVSISVTSCGGGGGPDALPASTQALAVINAVDDSGKAVTITTNGGASQNMNGAALPANLGTSSLQMSVVRDQ